MHYAHLFVAAFCAAAAAHNFKGTGTDAFLVALVVLNFGFFVRPITAI